MVTWQSQSQSSRSNTASKSVWPTYLGIIALLVLIIARICDDAAGVNLKCAAYARPWANWYGTVYHGLPSNLYAGGCGDGGYLAYIGRICPEKRPDWAIEIARRAGMPLTIAAKVDEVDRTYHETRIKPLLEDPRVDFVGEIGDSEKGAFLGDAAALLFPIDWPEPFGLALIEAMANGTPVIAFGRGSVPEIVEHSVTGLIVDSVDEAVAAVPLARTLDRVAIRRRFEERFSVGRMARDYLALYDAVLRPALRVRS
jgi:glycosyltransferase involved in cell wall biosynthesis